MTRHPGAQGPERPESAAGGGARPPTPPPPLPPAPPNSPPGQPRAAEENTKRGNVVAVLGTIRELLTNVVGIVTVVLSALATFGVGAAVGHSTASPAPARTVFVTAPPGPSTAAPSQAPPTTPATTALVLPPALADGTVLGSYTVDLGFGHSIPLGADKPTQKDFSTTGLGDLGTAAPADHLVFVPINGDRMLSLSSGVTPGFAACSTDTLFSTQADSKPGTAFCLIGSGTLAGVKVASAHPSYVTLSVTVWQYSGG